MHTQLLTPQYKERTPAKIKKNQPKAGLKTISEFLKWLVLATGYGV